MRTLTPLVAMLLALPAAAADVVLSAPFAPLPADAGLRLHVYDFDVTTEGEDFVFSWVGDFGLYTRRITTAGVAGAHARLAPLSTLYSSSVSSARGPTTPAMVAGSGFDGVFARPVGAAGPLGSAATRVSSVQSLPTFHAVAWNGDTALVAWTTPSTLSYVRVSRDGTVLDAAPGRVTFREGPFTPRLAMASNGSEWLIAVSASDPMFYRVTAGGGLVPVGPRGPWNSGQHIALVHGPAGYVYAVYDGAQSASQVLRLSEAGEVEAGPFSLADPTPSQPGITVLDLARDTRHFFVLEGHADHVTGYLLGLDGVPLDGGAFLVDATPGTGENVSVAAAGHGVWLATYGTWTYDNTDAWFGTVSARLVTVPGEEDAGLWDEPTDAGPLDAGTADAGNAGIDGGTGPEPRVGLAGCSCGASGAELALGLLALVGLVRRGARQRSGRCPK